MPRLIPSLFAFVFTITCAPAHADSFSQNVLPILQEKCLTCHGAEEQNAGVRLDVLSADLVAESKGAETWHDALNAVNKGEMPPEDATPLTATERDVLTGWISGELQRLRKSRKATGGQVVMRRLNRVEYQNTMTDLLGVELDFARNLPPDSLSDDGFQNNGAALQMSALQLEYYLKAARGGVRRAIVDGPAPDVFEHTATETVSDKGKGNWTNRLGRTGQFVARIPDFPDEGEFLIRVRAHAEIPEGAAFPVMQLRLGYRSDVRAPARVVGRIDVSNSTAKEFEFRGRFEEFPIQTRTQSKYPGMLVWIENVYSDGRPAPKPIQEKSVDAKGKKRNAGSWCGRKIVRFPSLLWTRFILKLPSF